MVYFVYEALIFLRRLGFQMIGLWDSVAPIYDNAESESGLENTFLVPQIIHRSLHSYVLGTG